MTFDEAMRAYWEGQNKAQDMKEKSAKTEGLLPQDALTVLASSQSGGVDLAEYFKSVVEDCQDHLSDVRVRPGTAIDTPTLGFLLTFDGNARSKLFNEEQQDQFDRLVAEANSRYIRLTAVPQTGPVLLSHLMKIV